jgi:RNA polymerase sigma-70 factor (ECF subfamily)
LQDYLTANYARLRQRLQRRLGCADAASECLHETWLHLARAAVAQSVQNPEAYLIRMACNVAIDLMRGSRTRHSVEVENEEYDTLPDSSPGPEAIVQARSEVRAVEQAMSCLPPRHRLVLLALRIEGKTREEVARAQGISTRRVDTILRQALDHCAGPGSPSVVRRLLPKEGRAPYGRSTGGAASRLPVYP